MKRIPGQHERHGFTLLLTLVTLILLASIMVQFQLDTTVHLRASSYRADQIQCRYAAESALVIAGQLIKDKLKQSQETKTNVSLPSSSPDTEDDKALLQAMEDLMGSDMTEEPNQLGDPNEENPNDYSEDFLFDAERDKLPPYIFLKKTIKIGKAEVDIEIQDENSKFPVFWILYSPYQKQAKYVDDALETLAELLETNYSAYKDTIQYTRDIGRPLAVPEPDRYLQQRKYTRGSRKGQTSWRYTRSRRTISTRRSARNAGKQPKTLSPEELQSQQYQKMGMFATEWNHQFKHGELKESLGSRLENRPGTFNDYLGYWGNQRININTAPREVIEAAFKPIGMTPELAQAIVTHRKEVSLGRGTINLKKLEDIDTSIKVDDEIHQAIRYLALPASDTFSIRIKARLGRARYNLTSGMYKSRNGKIINHAIIPGE
ncbi:MAG: general secretion pathway protein GspK [Sedimentisphaerales bacterium]|nr:general secretion pathway protein GspK [Sedimentisphaerales bacterium]